MQLIAILNKQFFLQVTALMGAHSLGRARTFNTGYSGLWTPGRTELFNNEFYRLLNDASLRFINRVRFHIIMKCT